MLQKQFIGSCVRNMWKRDKWYEHEPDSVSEKNEVKLLWDVNI